MHHPSSRHFHFKRIKQTALILCLLPVASYASVVNLQCPAADNTSQKNITIDYEKRTVIMNGAKMNDVIIERNEIHFTEIFANNEKWPHIVNRTTGGVRVRFPGTDTYFGNWKCEKENPKF